MCTPFLRLFWGFVSSPLAAGCTARALHTANAIPTTWESEERDQRGKMGMMELCATNAVFLMFFPLGSYAV
jgi:hypothetical protein